MLRLFFYIRAEGIIQKGEQLFHMPLWTCRITWSWNWPQDNVFENITVVNLKWLVVICGLSSWAQPTSCMLWSVKYLSCPSAVPNRQQKQVWILMDCHAKGGSYIAPVYFKPSWQVDSLFPFYPSNIHYEVTQWDSWLSWSLNLGLHYPSPTFYPLFHSGSHNYHAMLCPCLTVSHTAAKWH